MKFQFTQIYSEIDSVYYVPSKILIKLREKLNDLGKNIPHYSRLFNTNDYRLSIYISATSKNKELFVTRPLVLSKQKAVEFFIKIPYKKIDDFVLCMEYILSFVEEGIVIIFDKYKVEHDNIEEIFKSIKKMVSINTKIYKEEYDKIINRK